LSKEKDEAGVKYNLPEGFEDLNGKSDVVEWIGPGGAEVSVDAPHALAS
jgi:hypothetical protein